MYCCESESGWNGLSQGVAAVSIMDDGDNVSMVDNGDNEVVIVCGSISDIKLFFNMCMGGRLNQRYTSLFRFIGCIFRPRPW